MKLFHSAASASSFGKKGLALTLGNFDGLHAGHRLIMGTLLKEAKQRGLKAAAYTFDPHPAKLLAPHAAPQAINTLAQKIALFRGLGLDALIIESFDQNFARQSPEDFFKTYLLRRLHAAYLMVGYDFTFGAKRSGNVETLAQLSKKSGIECRVIAPQMLGQTLVSSTVVRQHIRDGRVDEVIGLLARPYFIDGTIIRGEGRGRTLGFPTMNLESDNELLPKQGVYLVEAWVGKQTYWGLTNVGIRPTFKNNAEPGIETHLPGFSGNAYGKRVRLYFWRYLRNEKKFASAAALTRQIKRDIARAEKIIHTLKEAKEYPRLAPPR